MTKEVRVVDDYRVQVTYRVGGQDPASTVLHLGADSRDEAEALGRRLFEEWVDYNRAHGYGDFTDLRVTRVTCRFVGSRDA
jgi:hypothetical protein